MDMMQRAHVYMLEKRHPEIMAFEPKHTLGGRLLDLPHDLEALAHIEAETQEIIFRSVAPRHVQAVMEKRNQFLRTLAAAYSWKHQQHRKSRRLEP